MSKKFKVVVLALFVILVGLSGYYVYLSGGLPDLGSKKDGMDSEDTSAYRNVPESIKNLPDYEPGNPRVNSLPEDVRKSTEVAKVLDVEITDKGFVPSEIIVSVGDIINFKNVDTNAHKVSGDTGSWYGRVLNTGEIFSQQFDVPGVYTYSDGLGAPFKGKVIVEK